MRGVRRSRMNFDDQNRRSPSGRKGAFPCRGTARPYEGGVQDRPWLSKFMRDRLSRLPNSRATIEGSPYEET
jgi:hypothetical protein